MPTLNIFEIGTTTCWWNVSDLSYPWNTAQYYQAYIRINNIASAPVYALGSGSQYQTQNGSYINLSPGTTYTATAHVITASGVTYGAGSRTFTTQSLPSPPTGRPTVSASASYSGGQHYVFVSWSSVSGATGYTIYANNYYKTSSTGTSTQITVDYEYTDYTIAVIPYNAVGNGLAGTTTVRTSDITPPVVTGFTVQANGIGANSVAVQASGTDSGSGVAGFYFYRNDVHVGTAYGSSVNYTYTGLSPQTTYALTCRAYDAQQNTSSLSVPRTVTTGGARPSNYIWSTTKTSGGNFNLSAAEWNGLLVRINAFRVYKGLSAYSFSLANTGASFQAVLFNQAVTAINAMGPPVNSPNIVTSGSNVFASQLNGLVSSLNSIL